MKYILTRTKSTATDKLAMSLTPNTANARLLRIEGGQLGDDPDKLNFWDISLVSNSKYWDISLVSYFKY